MSITAIIGNLAMVVGEDKDFQDQIKDSSGNPQNINGWSASFIVHTYGDPNTIWINKTTANGGMVPSDPIGAGYPNSFDTMVARADTVNMAPTTYEYRYERTDTNNDSVVTKGCFTLERL